MPVSCPKCRTDNSDGSRFCRECATPLSPAPSPGAPEPGASVPTTEGPIRELQTGTTFAGRYRIIEELGEGGMGRVYKAFDTKIREKIALKLVRPEIGSNPRIVERFANEIRLARKITHRNVCRLHDLGDERGTPYITMEYVSGEDLRSMLRMTGGLSPAQTVTIGRQIAEGLAEAHRLGVVHRDLKPHNVMIDRDGTARIMDFGIAFSARTKGLTDHGVMIGTPEYMSPEQADGDDVDGRSDIYSLGVMLFEMATGKPPFQGRSALAVALQHKTEAPPDPSTVNPRVPPDLSRLILKCLEKDPAARYPSTDAVVEDLDRIAADLPAATPALPQRPRTTSGATEARGWRRSLIPAAAVVIVAVAALFAWRTWGRQPGSSGAPAAVLNRNSVAVVGFDNETGDRRFDNLRTAIPRLLITSLENTGRFKVATWERMRDVLKQAGRRDVDIIDSEGGFDVCGREGIAFLVTGSVTKAGDTFATTVNVLDARTRTLVKSASARGQGENSILLTQLDEIGRQIANGLAPASEGGVKVAPLIDVTTNSMDAYSAYLRGSAAFDRLLYSDAITELKKAVAIDPQFAVAHLRLGIGYLNIGNRDERDRELKLAKLYSTRATDRERLLITAEYVWYIERDWDKRVAALRELTARYPDDKEAYYELAQAYAVRNMTAETIQAHEHALALDPSYGLALNSLAYIYVNLGKYDQGLQYLQKYAATSPGEANPVDSMGDVLFRMGRLDDAAAAFRRALDIRPDFGSDLQLAMTAALKEDYDAAFSWLDKRVANARTETAKAEAHGMRVLLYQLLGRNAEARDALRLTREAYARAHGGARADALEAWIAFDDQAWGESRRAFERFLAWMRTGEPAPTFQVLSSIARGSLDFSEGNYRGARSNLVTAQAAVANPSASISSAARLQVVRMQASLLAADGNTDPAIAVLAPVWPGSLPAFLFSSFIPYYCPLVQDDLARLYVRKNDWDHAIAQYRMLTIIGPEHANRRLIHPLYHYRFAQVLEQAGRKGEAIDQYERFLKLWEKASQARPEIKDARLRLAAIRGT